MNLFYKIRNFSIAVLKRMAGGMKNVAETEYIERMLVCGNCEHNSQGECLKCGCIISKKAWWQTEDCPENKWPNLK